MILSGPLGQVNKRKKSVIIVDITKAHQIGREPNALTITVPGHRPGNIADRQFGWPGPLADNARGVRAVRERRQRPASRRQKSEKHRQAGGEAKEADDQVAQFAHRQKNLVEQQQEKTHRENQSERRQQHEQVLGIDLRRIVRQIGAAQGLYKNQDQQRKQNEITKPG